MTFPRKPTQVFFRSSNQVASNNANWNTQGWNVMAHADRREGKWRGNWRMECVASTLHTTSEHGVSSITTADAHTSAASSQLNWPPPPGRFKCTRPFRRKAKSVFCACAITFQLASATLNMYNSDCRNRLWQDWITSYFLVNDPQSRNSPIVPSLRTYYLPNCSNIFRILMESNDFLLCLAPRATNPRFIHFNTFHALHPIPLKYILILFLHH